MDDLVKLLILTFFNTPAKFQNKKAIIFINVAFQCDF